MTQTGPFIHGPHDRWTRTLSSGGRYAILIVQAYEVCGIRDIAWNGIAVVSADESQVVLSSHLSVKGGYGIPTAEQRREAQRLIDLDDAAFARFCVRHPNFRGDTIAPELVRLAVTSKRTLPQILAEGLSYNEEDKREFHEEAKRLLRLVARNGLRLQPQQYDLLSSEPGRGISAKVTLHTAQWYVQVSQSSFGRTQDLHVLYRTCEGMQDYNGGENHFAPADALLDAEEFTNRLRRLVSAENAPSKGLGMRPTA